MKSGTKVWGLMISEQRVRRRDSPREVTEDLTAKVIWKDGDLAGLEVDPPLRADSSHGRLCGPHRQRGPEVTAPTADWPALQDGPGLSGYRVKTKWGSEPWVAG